MEDDEKQETRQVGPREPQDHGRLQEPREPPDHGNHEDQKDSKKQGNYKYHRTQKNQGDIEAWWNHLSSENSYQTYVLAPEFSLMKLTAFFPLSFLTNESVPLRM